MGMLSTQRANTIRGIYQTILSYHQRSAAHADRTVLTEEYLRQIREESPRALNLLEPLLTDEQLEWLMSGEADNEAM
jgi:hypothetical protein